MAQRRTRGVKGEPRATTPAPELSDQIIQAMASGVIVVDPAGTILLANAAAARHLGVPPGGVAPGVSLLEIPDVEPFADIYLELSRHRRSVERREIQLRTPRGDRREIGVTVSPLQGPEAFNGAIFLFTDMTERRRLERAMEVNRQLASVGELAAGMVHELRNPLTIIILQCEYLLRKMADDDPRRRSLETIVQESRNLEDAISQFLNFARPFELKPIQCTAGSIVSRAFQLCEKRALSRNVSLEYAESGKIDVMHVDEPRMAEALSNIVANAIDEAPTGGHVDIVASQADATTVFQISDNGPGIHLEEGEDLFSPFFTKKRDGTGLGLSIVQRIVTSQGGTITYANRPEGGVRFEICIPSVQGISD